MTGFVGGVDASDDLDGMAGELWSEPWHETERFEADGLGLHCRHHGERDSGGTTWWQEGRRVGLVSGAITNLDEVAGEPSTLFERLLDAPVDVLPRLDGPFVLVAADAADDRVVVATDKLGTRRVHVTADGSLRFGTSVGALLEYVDDPTIDHRGLSDLLALRAVWDDRTLVQEVRSLPTATVLEYDDGERSETTYWHPTIDPTPKERAPFVDGVRQRFQDAVDDVVGTVDGAPGLWLSGGLDSRVLASALDESCGRFETYTYDANPGDGTNPRLAGRVADELDLPNRIVDLSPEQFLSILDDGVAETDGLLTWKNFLNLSATFDLPSDAGVVLEGTVHSVPLGNALWQEHVEASDSPAEALYRADHYTDRDVVTDVLTADVDPMRTFREETSRDEVTGFLARAVYGRLRNHSRSVDCTGNQIARTQIGTRVHVVDGEYLSFAAGTPFTWWKRAVPLTGGRIPYGTTPMKLELTRAYDDGLESIPYQRTGLAPSRPLWQHAAGFVATTASARLRDEPAAGGRSLAGVWYRNHTGFRSRIDGLLADARERPCFDAGALDELQREHLDGAHRNMRAISCVTTAELWFQRYFDG